MQKVFLRKIVPIGFAMFSMFFGSGNIIFPILVGKTSLEQTPYAILGLILTAVVVPFIGFLSMLLFQGNYLSFFSRLGRPVGWLIVIAIMGLIGPFAIIPRCIIVAHSTVHHFIPHITLFWFSLVSCLLIYLCTMRRSRIIEILGVVLTPLLLMALVAIIISGFFAPYNSVHSNLSASNAFFFGLVEGYNTLDIFAGFMFAHVILESIKKIDSNLVNHPQQVVKTSIQAGCVGMGLLAAIYIGMCIVASFQATPLELVLTEGLLSVLAANTIGSNAGLIVSVAVSLACLTTAISLSLVFAEFVSESVFQGILSYRTMLVITLVISFIVSTLQFSGIQAFLVPILWICMPSFIALAIINLIYKLTPRFKWVKIPVVFVFLLSLFFYYRR